MRGLNVRELREALDGLDGDLEVGLLVDHALAGHGDEVTTCDDFDVELIAPVIAAGRTVACETAGSMVALRVAWEEAG